MLGIIFYEGDESIQDYKKSYNHCLVGAQSGYAYCQYLLGKMFYYGKGVKKDKNKSLVWMNKATKQQLTQAVEWLNKHSSK